MTEITHWITQLSTTQLRYCAPIGFPFWGLIAHCTAPWDLEWTNILWRSLMCTLCARITCTRDRPFDVPSQAQNKKREAFCSRAQRRHLSSSDSCEAGASDSQPRTPQSSALTLLNHWVSVPFRYMQWILFRETYPMKIQWYNSAKDLAFSTHPELL